MVLAVQQKKQSRHLRYSEKLIIDRARAHFQRFGRWPSAQSGTIEGVPGESWAKVNSALIRGNRGLRGGETLAGLLRRRVGKERRQYKPVLSCEQIIAWAREHFSLTGRWPSAASGRVIGGRGETWGSLDMALRVGRRGLPSGSSIALLLDEEVGHSRRPRKPPFTIGQIVDWARQHRNRTGVWPVASSGPIRGAPGETWRAVATALKLGQRGLPGGDTLPRVLNRYCGRRLGRQRRHLPVSRVLEWADAYHRRHGCWPSLESGPVQGAAGLTWGMVDYSLRHAGAASDGQSLAELLRERRGQSAAVGSMKLDIRQILRWADLHHRRTGRWPTGVIAHLTEGVPLTWRTINRRIKAGLARGVPAGTKLIDLLIKQRGAKFRISSRTPLSVKQVLAWADDHHERTGDWPKSKSGPIVGGPDGQTWARVDYALSMGSRGLPKVGSLARLLMKHRGVRNLRDLPPLSESRILGWADAFQERTGRWPGRNSEEILESPGETWRRVDHALVRGIRGLPGGDTLAGLLARRRGLRRTGYKPKLTVELILAWARTHHRQTGGWPSCKSGVVQAAPEETWTGVNAALNDGYRGLPKGVTLARLLNRIRGESGDLVRKRPLDLHDITMWARAYFRRTHQWPNKYDGRVDDAKGETWFGIDEALELGARGLPGGSSLKALVRGLKKPRAIRLGHSRHRGAAAIV